MSRLQVFTDAASPTLITDTQDGAQIAAHLAEVGVVFERWGTRDLPTGASEADILAAYAPEIERLQAQGGYRSVDALSVAPDNPNREALRAKFLSEHTHAEDEVRFFADGAGLFTLHIGDRVFNVLCERGDLISVPAGTPHWFDTGAEPDFTVLRLFINPDGWVARFTGDDIAQRYPRLERAAA
ncbi:MAG: 1,2-dihydroxy-3-keto-5-methylthiopentene dioxygenase [Sphingomonas sp.]